MTCHMGNPNCSCKSTSDGSFSECGCSNDCLCFGKAGLTTSVSSLSDKKYTLSVDNDSASVNIVGGSGKNVSTASFSDPLPILDDILKHLKELYQNETDHHMLALLTDATQAIELYSESKRTELQIDIMKEELEVN